MDELRQAMMGEHREDEPLRFPSPAPIADAAPLHGAATVLCLTADRFGEIHDLSNVAYGATGLTALSAAPMPPGIEVSIGFEAPGYTARHGVVQSCHPIRAGYQLTVHFHARLAA